MMSAPLIGALPSPPDIEIDTWLCVRAQELHYIRRAHVFILSRLLTATSLKRASAHATKIIKKNRYRLIYILVSTRVYNIADIIHADDIMFMADAMFSPARQLHAYLWYAYHAPMPAWGFAISSANANFTLYCHK